MNDLETRQLRYFVAVAEELHFGRAAERLGMAQPPLSRAIRDLERQLDVLLLRRTTRQVTLTPAGEVLLRDARTALDAISAAGRRARHAGEPTPRLRLALKPDIDGGLLPQILDAYAEEEAALPVELVLGRFGEQAQAVRDGRADTALLLAPFDERGLDSEPLATEPFLVALAAADPLAARSSLRLADLAGRSLPDGSPADHGPASGRHRSTGARDRQTGPVGDDPLTVSAAQSASDLPQIFRLVELGSIVCFFPTSVTRRYPRPEIAYRPVSDVEPATLAVAWPQDSHSAAVAAFVRTAAKVAADTPPDTGGTTDGSRMEPASTDELSWIGQSSLGRDGGRLGAEEG
ncbi:LysR family transcriptional regulator [Streptomyces sp. NPDC058001]|uniref:LysR family transcriptional regulator n=1 Tax=Streptomyces sp. NPDC058001 TaxID=3346300 RepID=UPI0036E90BE0